MSDNTKSPFWTRIIALLMPEYHLALRLDEKITGKDFISLFVKKPTLLCLLHATHYPGRNLHFPQFLSP